MSQLQDNLTEILRQKNTYLLPENIKKDITILGVTGEIEPSDSQLYTELEYIESTGTQYILPVEISSSTRKIVADVYLDSNTAPNRENTFLGCNNKDQGMECYTDTNNCIKFWVRNIITSSSNYATLGPSTPIYDQVIHYEVDLSSSGITLIINNTDTYTSSIKLSGTTNPPNYLTIFAHNGHYETRYPFIGRIYSLKLYQDDTLKYDFIPVKRNANNKICLYDKVGERFYENDGTGSFIAGPEKTNLEEVTNGENE